MQNSFHGRTYGAMALTTSKTYYRQGFGPFMPEVYISPYPYCLHCKVRQAAPGGKDWYKVRPDRRRSGLHGSGLGLRGQSCVCLLQGCTGCQMLQIFGQRLEIGPHTCAGHSLQSLAGCLLLPGCHSVAGYGLAAL